MNALEAALTRTIEWKRSKKKPRVPFCKTLTATRQRFYRKLVDENLRGCEQVVMRTMLNLSFRHFGKAMPVSIPDMMKRIGWSARQIGEVYKRLIAKGFLTLCGGGNGRGKPRVFSVNLRAIYETLAPEFSAEEKVAISHRPINKELKVGRANRWFAGLWGRSELFVERFLRSLAFDRDQNSRWNPPIAAKPAPTPSQKGAEVSQEAMTWDQFETHWLTTLTTYRL